MTSDFCVAALTEALSLYGTPEIFNTDQGSQFTSDALTSVNAYRDGITEFLTYYHEERPHNSVNDVTPDEVYHQSCINERAA